MAITKIVPKKYLNLASSAKSLIAELTPPYIQSAWRFKKEMVRTAGLVACCNYLSKTEHLLNKVLCNSDIYSSYSLILNSMPCDCVQYI